MNTPSQIPPCEHASLLPSSQIHHWLVKQEPSAYSWSTFKKEEQTDWTGVRNFQARNNLRAMKVGDLVLFYHSVKNPAVIGIAEVIREAFPDPTATEGEWSCVTLRALSALKRPVTLAEIKMDRSLAEMPLIKQSRLSVMPVTDEEFSRILEKGNEASPGDA